MGMVPCATLMRNSVGMGRMLNTERLLASAKRFIKRILLEIDERSGLTSLLLSPYIAFKASRSDLDTVLNTLFNDSIFATLFKPFQIKEEIQCLLDFLKDLRLQLRYILEIGTARGGTLLIWTRVAQEDAVIISVDLPGGAFGGGYPFLKGLVYKCFKRGNQRIVLIRGDSHSEETLNRVRKVLKGAKLDLLFIDGDHSYEGVKKDFEMYAPLVRKGGVIVFHDIVPGPSHLVGGVPRFWNELKHKLIRSGTALFKEFVRDWSQKGYGLGVVVVSDEEIHTHC